MKVTIRPQRLHNLYNREEDIDVDLVFATDRITTAGLSVTRKRRKRAYRRLRDERVERFVIVTHEN